MRPIRTINRLLVTNLLNTTQVYKTIFKGKQSRLFDLLKSEILFTFYNISGVFLINDIPNCSYPFLTVDAQLSFTSNEVDFDGIFIDKDEQTLYYLLYKKIGDLDPVTLAILNTDAFTLRQLGQTGPLGMPVFNQMTGWVDPAYKNIILTADNQSIPSSLYMWLSANAQQVE